MVEFMSGYLDAMNRPEGENISVEALPNIEEPIIPISELGTTAIDVGQTGHILQNLDKSIRMGAKKIQLIVSGGGQGNPSSLVSSHGKDVRQEIKEKAKSTGVEITGVELSPSRVSGLAGYNPQSGTVNEEVRQNSLREVKYAVKFAADVAGGGGVDVWSQEFNRNIFDATWNKGSDGKQIFFDNNQEELDDISKAQLTKYLIDARSGEVVRDSVVRTNHYLHLVDYETAKDRGVVGQKDKNGRILGEGDYVDIEGNYVNRYDPKEVDKLIPKFDPKTKLFSMQKLDWNMIEKETEKYNREYRNGDPELTPEEWAYRVRLLTNIASTKGHGLYYFNDVDQAYGRLKEVVDEKKQVVELEKKMSEKEREIWVQDRVSKMQEKARMYGGMPMEEAERLRTMTPSELISEDVRRQEIRIQGFQELVTTYRQQEEELYELWENVKTPYKYAGEKTWDSYAEAGKYAYRVTKEQHLDKPVYVGPEIGWAGQTYGGHPDEFIEIIKESRKKMAEKMKADGMTESAAKDAAKKHIKGMLDTSHLTMWYKHFVRNPQHTDEQHLKRFNGWAQEQVRKMVREDTVGGVQIVDSITGEHAHLPPGQGIFDIVDMVKIMKEEGFTGPIISEGHEEEQITAGRILTETWRAFGSNIQSVAPGQPAGTNTWRGTQHSYFGYRMPHTYIVGAYSPSNEWQLWSETPFE